MKYFALFYDVVEDFVVRRTPFRDEHLRLARESKERGELVFGGALADPVDQALLVFRAADAAVVEHFVANDPYVRNGLVTRWRIRPWAVAVD
jgi:uncharacterized protein